MSIAFFLPSRLTSECLMSCDYEWSCWIMATQVCVCVCILCCTLSALERVTQGGKAGVSVKQKPFIYLSSHSHTHTPSSLLPWQRVTSPYLSVPPGTASRCPVVLSSFSGIFAVIMNNGAAYCAGRAAARPALHPVWCFHNKIKLILNADVTACFIVWLSNVNITTS